MIKYSLHTFSEPLGMFNSLCGAEHHTVMLLWWMCMSMRALSVLWIPRPLPLINRFVYVFLRRLYKHTWITCFEHYEHNKDIIKLSVERFRPGERLLYFGALIAFWQLKQFFVTISKSPVNFRMNRISLASPIYFTQWNGSRIPSQQLSLRPMKWVWIPSCSNQYPMELILSDQS